MAENNFSLQKTLTMLLDEKKYHSLRDILSTMNPADIAAIFDDLDQACLPLLFRLLPKELAAETFVEMEPEAQELLIRGFSDSELKEVIDELYVDDAVDIVEEMPANVVQRILSQAEPDMRKQINEILRYPEDSAGSIMTTEYVSLRPNMTVEEAILRIRRTGIDKETIYTCYVTRGHKLIGLTSVKDLLLCEDDDATIRSILDGTVFRAPILLDSIKPVVRNWEKPITIARHAYGDVYKSVSFATDEPGECTMTFRGASGKEQTVLVQKVDGPAVFQGEHNKESSIRSFAKACFQYAIDTKQDLWFSTKDTIAKVYDGAFKRIFEEEYEQTYKAQFEALGLTYFYTLIDDAVARVIRSRGGFIWACKNYDGDVMSDMVSTAFGSLAMMTSVLVAPDGTTEYEAAHGTVTRHYYRYLQGEKTSTNPMATIFAWTGALRKRGQLDGLADLAAFADKLEAASLDTIRAGVMTKDLAGLVEGPAPKAVTSEDFLHAIRARLEA